MYQTRRKEVERGIASIDPGSPATQVSLQLHFSSHKAPMTKNKEGQSPPFLATQNKYLRPPMSRAGKCS
ncbi:hypothetical protein I79_022485 [Cricetulus griseus]|uniref:Uncharacterized protein n=1 Tax=Cricetulus griseus TaxID=10029 RepID=G3IFG3_CRIGR|nr:hypothetical protein I79_022485 [Cricetulus griseus]